VLAANRLHGGQSSRDKLERRHAQVAAGLDRQRTEAIEAFERGSYRRAGTSPSPGHAGGDTEAERAVLDARLRELAKRLDETFART